MEKTTLYLPAELDWAVKDLARRTGKSQAHLIREAVATYIAQQRPEEDDLPMSIGCIANGAPSGEASEDWLRREWDRKHQDYLEYRKSVGDAG
ncbi:MAG: CopG family transcriptional regulator [Chloroflexota bacterium]|nr:CopG family transcriptional regulator [Chloroflexota bacterium]